LCVSPKDLENADRAPVAQLDRALLSGNSVTLILLAVIIGKYRLESQETKGFADGRYSRGHRLATHFSARP